MTIYELNPLTDDRWREFVARHPNASAFHTCGWIESLGRTYGYHPVVLTTTPPTMPLRDGIAFCRVSSWLTGKRLVSLPFADHCDLLLSNDRSLEPFEEWVGSNCEREKWRYTELRPITFRPALSSSMLPARSFYFHSLDLAPSAERIFARMHKNCIQRMVRRAEREKLTYEVGCSQELLGEFYRLLIRTRRRLGLVPQPREWFGNLVQSMKSSLQIRVARKNNVPVASILSLRHNGSVIYKYGCSDERFHHLGSMPFLFWKLIEESRASGATEIDLGRSDLENEGLASFKDRLGASRKLLSYFRYLPNQRTSMVFTDKSRMARRIVSLLPATLLPVAGRAFYRHMG